MHIERCPGPAKISCLVGHETAIQQFIASHASGRLHHAWMITGLRGIGKASLAFAFSKYLLRTAPHDGSPFLNWDDKVHRQIAEESHPGLIHLTPRWDEEKKRMKSRLSINEIRKIRTLFDMSSGSNSWRIAIIDSADEMTSNAARALLKIVEEPPKQSLFFILVHSAGMIIRTFRSRCQILRLSHLSDEEILSILNQFKLEVDEYDLSYCVQLSNGSVSKALHLLEGNIIAEYRIFVKLMEDRAMGSAKEWLSAISIANNLASRENEGAFQLFIELVSNWLENQVRLQLDGWPLSSSSLAPIAKVWEKLNESLTVLDEYNLDRKQIILTLFQRLFALNKI
ncbi:DNA polymerase III subunit delta' [Candidatus Endowatersipora endosymbiont of Watersipora subatra]|uniref:DNA polymerase III subunit delta' n=1 Tax=Candidatus Endowatersipora endosymbiont of Watersipora subatra TaxID=3077946 RepID=UPI00312C8D62